MGSGGTIGSGGGWGWGALTARKVVLHQSAVALIVAFPLIGFPFGGAGKGGGAVLGFWGLGFGVGAKETLKGFQDPPRDPIGRFDCRNESQVRSNRVPDLQWDRRWDSGSLWDLGGLRGSEIPPPHPKKNPKSLHGVEQRGGVHGDVVQVGPHVEAVDHVVGVPLPRHPTRTHTPMGGPQIPKIHPKRTPDSKGTPKDPKRPPKRSTKSHRFRPTDIPVQCP